MFLKVKDGNNWVEIPMIKGDTGATGPAGQDGQDGQDGVGVPSGGTQGQVLAKASATDYDTTWVTPVTMTDVQNYVDSLDGTNISY